MGSVVVTSLLDGISAITDAHFPDAGPQRIGELRAEAGFEAGPMPLPFNTFHFVLDGLQYLVDVGNNRNINPLTGRVGEAMAAAGIEPDAIDRILVTHAHVDHVTGLLDQDGCKLFANAEIILPRQELEFWGDRSKMNSAPAEISRVVGHVAPVLEAYRGQLRPFDGAPAIVPGIECVALYGHTPAHTGYRLTSVGQTLFFWGDTVHLSAFQLPEPDWSLVYDVDPTAAVATRRHVLANITRDKQRVAGAHLPANGIGFIEGTGLCYRFEPLL